MLRDGRFRKGESPNELGSYARRAAAPVGAQLCCAMPFSEKTNRPMNWAPTRGGPQPL